MRIDGHAHIFTLQTVLTKHAVKVMADRIRHRGLPEFVAAGLETFLNEQLKRPEVLTEEELLGRFLDRIMGTNAYKQFTKATSGLPVEILVSGDGLRSLKRDALRSALTRLSALFDDGSAIGTTIADVFETLRIAMRSDITSVADKLLSTMGPEDAIVALMMDITSAQSAATDRGKFLAQMKGTREAAIARPGRVLPFVAVNTQRPDHLALMRQALEAHGFVGVKLYPSLGSPVTSDAMKKVYDYCVEHDVPILLHSTRGGFYETESTRNFGDPALWADILGDRPGLRVCFAHAGGVDQGIVEPGGPQPPQWPHEIMELMFAFDHVYTDLAYNSEQMESPEKTARYLAWLRGFLTDPVLGKRVIWGSDYWLVRLSFDAAFFRDWYTSRLSAVELRQLMEEAPRRFLGLPASDGSGMRANVRRYVDFLAAQPAVGGDPPAWLRSAAGTPFTVRYTDPLWSSNNHAHLLTSRFFERYMHAGQKGLPFAAVGQLRLRQLTYWNKEHVTAHVFAKDCRDVAIELGSLAKGRHGGFEGDYNDKSATDALFAVLKDGERTVADVGSVVDAVFRYSTEVL